jgi:NB-ARC domain
MENQFGKTTLARQIAGDLRVRRRFGAGTWAKIGERPTGSELAAIVNDVYFDLTGYRPSLVDPESAGRNLGELLDRSPRVLLIIDDVWRKEQLSPFMQGGRRRTRLVTTRRPNVLSDRAENLSVKVDELEPEQAKTILRAGLPPINHDRVLRLLHLTYNWPLLVQLTNRHLRISVEAGVDVNSAAVALEARLEESPVALDMADEVSRDQAYRVGLWSCI